MTQNMYPEKKLQKLKRILKEMKGVVIAFSGGTDSALLLKVAVDALGEKVLAVTASSETYPREELKAAREIACRLGVKHKRVKTGEWADVHFRANPVNRCYFCKKELFKTLAEIAGRENLPFVVDGTTRSDLSDFRPGSRAAKEFSVRHPLLEAGLTKKEVRVLSRKFSLPTAEKPAAACLASRIPYGIPLTREALEKVAKAERYLRCRGVSGNIRLRYHQEIARIEVDKYNFHKILDAHLKIAKYFKKIGFKFVVLDLEGYRTGSFNPTSRGRIPA
ncbi:MAG: ATP-dependent sacrificial sulfur transferase LarE [Candidatus Omnitrophota bacterium]